MKLQAARKDQEAVEIHRARRSAFRWGQIDPRDKLNFMEMCGESTAEPTCPQFIQNGDLACNLENDSFRTVFIRFLYFPMLCDSSPCFTGNLFHFDSTFLTARSLVKTNYCIYIKASIEAKRGGCKIKSQPSKLVQIDHVVVSRNRVTP